MKFLFTFLTILFLALPAWAVDVQMGYDGNLVFEPNEITTVSYTHLTLPTILLV